MEKDSHKAKEKWKQAQEAAEKAKEAAEAAKKDGEGEAAKTAREAEKKLPENPMDFVSLWKKSPILTLVVENSSQISPKSISQKNSIQNRKLETGNLEKAGKETLEKLWLIQYLNTYFSCQSGAGAGGGDSHALDYELEYCIGGKETDSQNLEFCNYYAGQRQTGPCNGDSCGCRGIYRTSSADPGSAGWNSAWMELYGKHSGCQTSSGRGKSTSDQRSVSVAE